MTTRLFVTGRDGALLHDLYRNVQLSFAQIHQRHFQGRSRSTVANRLSRLKRVALITGHRVGKISYRDELAAVGSVYQVSRKGIALLEGEHAHKDFREVAPRLNLYSLSHDLLLTEVMDRLVPRFPGKHIVHGKLSDRRAAARRRSPDAVIVNPLTSETVAVEVELVAKSNSRYRQIILQYRQDPRFSRVLYVVGNTSIAEKIRYQITGVRPIKGIAAPATGKFEFLSLSALLASNFQKGNDA